MVDDGLPQLEGAPGRRIPTPAIRIDIDVPSLGTSIMKLLEQRDDQIRARTREVIEETLANFDYEGRVKEIVIEALEAKIQREVEISLADSSVRSQIVGVINGEIDETIEEITRALRSKRK